MPDRMAATAHVTRSHVAVHVLDPPTMSYALVDSPVDTAAWLWERRRAWSDCNGDVAVEWPGDPSPVLGQLCVFGPAEQDLIE